jgi:hypothetical protein
MQRLLLDEIDLQAAGYATGFERDMGGWQADGFVRLETIYPRAIPCWW